MSLTSRMSVSEVADFVQKLSFEVNEKADKMEDTCNAQATQIMELTTELGKSRAEASELKNRIKRMEEEAVKMKMKILEKGKTVELVERKGSRPRAPKVDTGKDPISIFPEEIWNMIFGHVKEPQDLKSCYQTCTKFMWMLQDKRSTFLFLDVLKVLQNQPPGMNLITHPRDPTDPRDFSELFNCRRVCYGWKHSVDTYLQENCPINEPVVGRRLTIPVPTALKFTLTQSPWTKHSALRNRNAGLNPMISRYVALIYSMDIRPRNVSKRQNAFRAFLQKFGHHVWHFKLCYSPQNLSLESWYPSLLTWIRLMPNLKCLYFYHLDRSNDDSLLECLKENPFPTLPSLQSVALTCSPAEILASVLTANPQIENLRVCESWIPSSVANSLPVDQLKELILVCTFYCCKSLLTVNWRNLSKLTLKAPAGKWSQVFRALEKFAGTLTELDLELSGPSRETGLRLNLPNLRDLKLRITRCFNSIDFILPLLNLEDLTVELTGMHELDIADYSSVYSDMEDWGVEYMPIAEIPETVKLHGCIQDLRKSNIWRLFPKLKKVMARSDHFQDMIKSEDDEDFGSSDEDEEEEKEDRPTPFYNTKWKYCSRNQVDL